MSKATDAMIAAVDIIHDEFGDDAHFTARDCPAVACSVVISHNQAQYGEVARVSGKTVVISVKREQVTELPRRGDVFDVTTGNYAGRTFTVDSALSSDEYQHRVLAA